MSLQQALDEAKEDSKWGLGKVRVVLKQTDGYTVVPLAEIGLFQYSSVVCTYFRGIKTTWP